MATYTTTNAPLPYMEPYLQDFLARSQELANQSYQASPQTYTGPNQTLQNAWQATANRAMQGSPLMGTANQQLQGAMTGAMGYDPARNTDLNMNPYAGAMNAFAGISNPFAQMNNPFLNQSIADAQGDLVRSYNLTQKPAWDTAMQRSGSFGNTGVMEMQQNAQNDLQRNLGRIGSDMRMSAYNQAAGLAENQANRMFGAGQQQAQNLFGAGQQFTQNQFGAGQQYAADRNAASQFGRNLQMNALGMAPQFANQDYFDAQQLTNVGNQMQMFDQSQADQNYRWWQEAMNFPRQQLQAYGSALGAGQGGTSTQTAPDPSTASQLVGGALTGAQLYKLLFGG